MPDTEVLDERDVHETPEEERDESLDDEFGEFMDGELCAVDATNDRIDLEDLTEEQVNVLETLSKEASQRDLTSYRIEVRDAWKQRYFYRGNQYLLPGKTGAWVLPRMVLMSGQSYDDHNQETNVYLAFCDTVTAALTAGIPSTRFEAEDPGNPTDITAAEKSDGARKLLERANDMLTLQADLCNYLWTDGRGLFYTHHELDAQRFGWTKSDVDEELSFMPGEDVSNDEGVREPRSQQVIEAFGALETKCPIQAKDIHACDYIKLSREFDITRMKTKYPKYRDEIVASVAPTAQSDYVRLARVSINMGMRPSNMTTDAQTYNATEDLTWCRPSFFQCEGITEKMQQWLLDTFPKGCMVAMVGKTVVEARNESLDDHWTLFHGRPGHGMHRPSLGYPLVPLQEKLNDCMDLVHESFMHLIPRIWLDPRIDADALEKTERKPGQYLKAPKAAEGKTIADNFFAEPQLQLAEGLLVYIEKLFGEFAQFLVGAFPALFGGDTKSNDTASGINSQRDQALGRIGLTWRSIKGGYARTMRQAVQGVGEYQKGRFSGEISVGPGKKEYLEIDPNDLKGNIKCFPDTDENFPESWVVQRAVWNALLAAAATNPVIAKIVSLPKNILVMKDKIGTPELAIPEAASERKQLAEIKELLDTEPMPNPIAQQAAAQIQKLALAQAPPEIMQLAKQKVSTIPQMISSVPIDKELDEHGFEAAAIRTFASSEEGIKAKQAKPKGWLNLKLHYSEHIAAGMEAAANAAANKPPSESINYKDLETADAKSQMLKQAGIHIEQADLEAEIAKEKQEAAAKVALAAAAKSSGAAGAQGSQESGAPKTGGT
jgi:hypothetical protein